MSDPVAIAIIAACGTIPPSIVGLVSAFFAYKASAHSRAALEVARQTEANTNHMKDELVAITRVSAHAEGVLEEKKRTEETKE